MSSEQWRVVKDEFEKIRELPPEARQQAISDIADEEVRREVEWVWFTKAGAPTANSTSRSR